MATHNEVPLRGVLLCSYKEMGLSKNKAGRQLSAAMGTAPMFDVCFFNSGNRVLSDPSLTVWRSLV